MRKVKLFIVYFPILLVTGQVLINLFSFVDNRSYIAAGFYLNTFFGTNVFFSLFLLAFTFSFKFCAVSRAAAVAEFLFAANYMIVQVDNLYNISFQVIVGLVAIGFTFFNYLRKFPLCRMSLLMGFLGSVISNMSCKRGLDEWERSIKGIILRNKRHDY